MNATALSYTAQIQPSLFHKPRLLLVSDSRERLQHLYGSLNSEEVEITSACSVAELQAELQQGRRPVHALAAVDVAPAKLTEVLRTIRTSAGHSEIPVLVEATRLELTQELAGVLPQYRAMPCSTEEMIALARPRAPRASALRAGRGIL